MAEEFKTWAGAVAQPEMTVLADHPASGGLAAPDRLQLESRLSAVFDILRHEKTRCPITVAIYGDWGTGKTSAMRWLETQLRSWNEVRPEHRGKHPRVYPIWFDPWRYHTREEVWRGIIAEVILSLFTVKQLDSENATTRMREAAKMFGSFLGRGFLHALANLEVNIGSKQVAEVKIKGQVFRDIYDEYDKAAHPSKAHLNQFEDTLRTWVRHFLKSQNGVFSERLAIFIDDLDRCMPDVTLEVLEAIKLYLNIEPLVFVVGVDRLVVDGIVRKRYLDSGVSELKSREYLNKIFQVEVQIPPSEAQMEKYLEGQIAAIDAGTDGFWAKMLGGVEETNRKAVEEGIRQLSRHNPREVKRLLNSALLVGRGVAARGRNEAHQARGIRFAQGVQFFLLQRLVQERISESSQILIKRQNLEWFEHFSDFVQRNSSFEPTTDELSKIQEGAEASVSDPQKKRSGGKATIHLSERATKQLQQLIMARPVNDVGLPLDLAFLASPTLWCLLRVPFSVEVAQFAPTSIASIATGRLQETQRSTGAPENVLDGLPNIIRDRLAVSINKPVGELTRDDLARVRELSLESSEISDSELAALSRLSSLQKLSLAKSKITDSGLSELLKLGSLQNLNLRETKITDLGLEVVARIPALAILNISGTQITDSGLPQLSKASSLRGLNISNNEITDLGSSHISKISALNSLQLRNARISDTGIRELSKLEALQSLDLSGTAISDASLASIGQLKRLVELRMSGVGVSDAGFAHLVDLPSLDSLDASSTGITDTGLKHVAKLETLTNLDLQDTKITDEGLRYLASLQKLRSLTLWSTAVSDAGMKELIGLPKLAVLDLDQTKVTSAGLEDIAKIKSLSMLFCNNKNISKRAWQQLKERIPTLTTFED